MKKKQRVIWFISEVYYPDEQGAAHLTTELAEGLAGQFTVKVLCGYPTVTARGLKVDKKAVLNGVSIVRCRGTTFDKNVFVLRLINLFTISVSIFLGMLMKIRKNDVVLVVTSPPSLPFIARIACSLRQTKCVLRIDDVYPETMVATGMLRQDGMITGLMQRLNGWLYRSVDHIVVLGRDMRALAVRKMGGSRSEKVSIVNNWADTDAVFPTPKASNSLLRKLGVERKFIVSCAGNMGRAQAIETIFDAVTRLRDVNDVHFLFIGSGAKKSWMEKEAKRRGLNNVSLIGQRPREDQINFLNACDVSMVSLLPGMTGAGVPSRMYNIMAAGKPIIAIVGRDSETVLVVEEEGIGWVVPPDAPEKLVEAIMDAKSDTKRLELMARKAYAVVKEKYSRERAVKEYSNLIESLHTSRHA